MPEEPLHHLLWAKGDKSGQFHPLICHLVDVAQVAQSLWDYVLTDSLRDHFADLLGLGRDDSGRLLSFWIGLHDLGKASPAFQRRCVSAHARLADAGLTFPKLLAHQRCAHASLSAVTLEQLLKTDMGLSRLAARLVARALGGHHGAWPPARELQRVGSAHLGGNDWTAVRRKLLREMVAMLQPPQMQTLAAAGEADALLTLLSGLCVAADWVGSMEKYFAYADTPVDTAAYSARSAAQAQRALHDLGWVGWAPPSEPASFQELFPFQPRPMQSAVIALGQTLHEPALVIIEAPTGTGKTEAALYLADRWAVVRQQRGLYVAMPTMATSNQMFARVRTALAQRYPNTLVNLHLVHSQAGWRDDVRALQLDTVDEVEGGTVAAMSWFLPRKRTLLAPFGVGTVDQALLSVLQTRHFFLRLFGLSHKTVIFDEVHAYDTYMSTIFQRLLGWLRTLGTSVVLLSATLPRRTRSELVEAYSGKADALPQDVEYPALTWATGHQAGVVPLPEGEERTIALEWVGRQPEAIGERLSAQLAEGGCAAVICNTVGRAQELYRGLREAGSVSAGNLHLFHARFPPIWRNEIEQTVLSAFGKDGDRPHRAIVVATQVIEQSLDLDFDVMVTELAPVDLMLQRAGRLHRHEREARPGPCSSPRLLVTQPCEVDGVPNFGADIWVYERYVLLRSYMALQGRRAIALPRETSVLIESVYGDEQLPQELLTAKVKAALAEAVERMRRHEEEHVYKARLKLVPDPRGNELLSLRSLALEEDSPELHQAFRALTRLTAPAISLVCLHQSAPGLSLEPDGAGRIIDLQEPPDEHRTRDLAEHTVRVSHHEVFEHFLSTPVPPAWKDHPLLRFHRPAIFEQGACPLEGTRCVLRLTRELGLEIDREEV